MPAHHEEPAGSFFLASSTAVEGPLPTAACSRAQLRTGPSHQGSKAETWTAHCDGGAWPNPGTMALGAVLTSPDGITHHLSQRLSGSGCNNEAEWRATVAALSFALNHGARRLHLHTDSTQVRDHLSLLDAPTLPPALQTWVNEARSLADGLTCLTVQWVPRHRNAQADALARQALGLPPKDVDTPHPKARRRR